MPFGQPMFEEDDNDQIQTQLEKTLAEEAAKKAEDDRLAAEEAAKKVEPAKTVPPPKEDPKTPETGEEDEGEGKEESGEDPDSDLAILEDIDKIHGRKIEVEYGDTDPLSAEGLYKRDKAIEKRALEDYEEVLKKKAPQAYKAFLLEQQGLNPMDAFQEDYFDYTKINLKDAKDELLEDVYAEYLKKIKKNDEEEVEEMIEAAKKKGTLGAKAEKGLESLVKWQKENDKEVENKAKDAKEKQDKAISTVKTKVTDIITKGQLNTFIVPEKEREPFAKAFLEKLRYHNGKMVLYEEISDEELEARLQAEYFKRRKGDLKDLVVKEAKSESIRRLKRTVKENEKGEKKRTEPERRSFKDIVLGRE